MQTTDATLGDPTPTLSPPIQARVKLFWLTHEGQWDDRGTGYCVYMDGTDADPDEFIVRSEVDNTNLVASKVSLDIEYTRQEDTLILWTDDNRDEFALSFQEPKDCDEIWQRIQGKQEVLMKTLADGSTDDDDDYADDPAAKTTTLPAPELGNLAQIATLLQNVVTIDEKEKIAAYILDSDYLPKLVNLFESCEDLESTEDLHTLYTIMKSLIMFNSNKLVETIIKDEHIMNVAGMLEYKPDRPHEKANYREVLLAQANMELVVPLNNEQVMTKIRETFRLQYLKDVILARYLSEELAATLQHFTLVSQMDIIDHIRNDHVYLACLFTLLKQPTTTDEQKIKVAECVLQLIAISKGLQVAQRTALFRTLVTHGLFDVFEVAMASPVEWLRTAGVNALSALVEADVSLTRSTLLKQMDERKPDQPADAPTDLMARMLKQFVAAKDPGLKIQYFEVLKMLLESPTQLPGAFSSEILRKQTGEVNDLLIAFYDHYVGCLFDPFKALEEQPIGLMGPVTPLRIDHDTAEVYAYLLEFLCFCVKQHSFRMRQQLIHSEVFVKIIQLYRCPFTYIKLTVLRFFRTVVGTNDDFYIRQLIKHQVFEPTIRVFLDTDQRNNLLNSAFLELIDYISKAKDISTLLITHLVDNFGHVLDTVTYVPTCQDLRKAYANLNNELGSAHSSPTPDQDADATKDWLKDHEEKSRASEERYFNESDDDDDQYHTALDSFDSDDDEHRETSKATEQMEEIVAEPVTETITVPSMDAAEVAASSMSSPPGAFVGPPPPPPLKRKLEDDDDDDDDDVLAAKASSSAAKKTKAVLSPPQDTVQDAADASMDVDGAEEEKDKEPADVDMASDAQEANHVVTIKLSPRLRASPTRLRRTTATTTTKQQQANKENDKNDKPEDDKPKDAPSPRSTRASTRAAAAAAAATQTTTGAISFKLTPPALVSSHQRKTKQMTEKSPDDHEEPKNDN